MRKEIATQLSQARLPRHTLLGFALLLSGIRSFPLFSSCPLLRSLSARWTKTSSRVLRRPSVSQWFRNIPFRVTASANILTRRSISLAVFGVFCSRCHAFSILISYSSMIILETGDFGISNLGLERRNSKDVDVLASLRNLQVPPEPPTNSS